MSFHAPDQGFKRLFDAIMSGDVDRLEFEMEEARREQFRKNIPDFMDGFKKAYQKRQRDMTVPDPSFNALIPQLLRDWLASPEGQHAPPASGLKGRLQLWKEVESAQLPTIRADLVKPVLDGKVFVEGVELVALLVKKLDDDAKVVLYSRSLGKSKI